MTAALFVGLATLYVTYAVHRYPGEDTKSKALEQFLGAGGQPRTPLSPARSCNRAPRPSRPGADSTSVTMPSISAVPWDWYLKELCGRETEACRGQQ